jgi:hypothetical protein
MRTFFVTVVADIDCNFDINFCDWQQDVTDDFNWIKGLNGYWHTGPSYDHTTGGKICYSLN